MTAIRRMTGWRWCRRHLLAAAGSPTPSPTCEPWLRFVHTRCELSCASAGVYIADALSMPVHWYYDVRALQRDFGRITTYQAPKERHPGGHAALPVNLQLPGSRSGSR
jgi:hypothetical protein